MQVDEEVDVECTLACGNITTCVHTLTDDNKVPSNR